MGNSRVSARFALGIALLLASAGLQAQPAEYEFRVLLDDKEIGSHTFRVSDTDRGREVDVRARFDVSILFVPVYSYRHENREFWRDGCLKRIESETDDNGTFYEVEGHAGDRGFVVTSTGGEEVHSGCIMSFAYWDRSILEQRRLLNAQTGDYLEVSVEPLGGETLETALGNIQTEAYRLRAPEKDVDITLWYAVEDGRWVALESRVKSGRTIRYLPQRIPPGVMAGNGETRNL
jgi:hypothetical protein